jgi:Tol biopolymer transport system component
MIEVTMKSTMRWIILLGALACLFVVPAVLAQGPTGSSPLDAYTFTSEQRMIGGNSMLWFYFDYPGDRSQVEVGLNSNLAQALQLAIYTPEQAQMWLRDLSVTPIGIATKPSEGSATAGYDLYWRGSFNLAGRYFIAVTNRNSTPVVFRLSARGDTVTLYPTPTPTLGIAAPPATPIPQGTLQGKLVFQTSSGGNIYTVNGDGTNLKRIMDGALDPAWSPNGDAIVYTRWQTKPGVYIARADGSFETALVGVNQALSPQWSPDGSRIVYVRQTGGTLYDRTVCIGKLCYTESADPRWKLGMIEFKINEQGDLYNEFSDPPCTNHCFAPTWSRDSRYIAYADGQYGVMRTDTLSNTLWMMYNQNPKVQSTAWSPDGTQIAFQVNQHDHWEIYVMNADATNARPLTQPDPLSFRPANNVSPVWSPDSKQILFVSDRNGKWEFFVINADGTGLRQVLKNVTDITGLYYNFSNERMASWTK